MKKSIYIASILFVFLTNFVKSGPYDPIYKGMTTDTIYFQDADSAFIYYSDSLLWICINGTCFHVDSMLLATPDSAVKAHYADSSGLTYLADIAKYARNVDTADKNMYVKGKAMYDTSYWSGSRYFQGVSFRFETTAGVDMYYFGTGENRYFVDLGGSGNYSAYLQSDPTAPTETPSVSARGQKDNGLSFPATNACGLSAGNDTKIWVYDTEVKIDEALHIAGDSIYIDSATIESLTKGSHLVYYDSITNKITATAISLERMATFNATDSSIAITSSGVRYTFTKWVTDTAVNMTVTDSTVIIPEDGLYHVGGNTSFSGINNAVVEFDLYINDGINTSVGFERKLSAAGDVGAAGFGDYIYLSAGDILKMKLESSVTGTLTGNRANYFVRKVN